MANGTPFAVAPGDLIGGCRIHRPIASGAVGALFGAIDEATGDARAVKVLALRDGAGTIERAEAARRFNLETQAAARLDQPDIVRIHRTGTQGGMAWLVMDLLSGCDLSRYTRVARLLPPAEVMRIAERLALALAHAHRHGIVHRDIKPANVMVDWPTRRLTLTDFGVARLADAERTRTGLVLGSPAFMAPELLAGGAASAASDLYALGVLTFQLISARLPFEADSLGELLRRTAQTTAPALRELQPGTPAALGDLVAALLAKSPRQRPADGAAVAAALAALRGAQPTRL